MAPLRAAVQGWPGWLKDADHGRLGVQLLLMLFSSGLATMALSLLPPLQHFEHQLYDLRLYYQNPQHLHPDLLLVRMSQSEGPRLAQFLSKLPDQGLKAVGLDTPHLFEQGQGPALRKLAAARHLPLVLSTGFERDKGQPRRIHRHPLSAAAGIGSGISQGFAWYPADVDGTIRAQPLLLSYQTADHQTRRVASFAYELARAVDPRRATDRPEHWLAYPGTQTAYPVMSLKALEKQPPASLRGKVLLVSDQAGSLTGRTPFQASISQLELHAYALAGLLEGRTYTRPPLLNALMPLLLPLLSLGLLWLTLRWGLVAAGLAQVIPVFCYFSLNILLFQNKAIWLDLAVPLIATAIGVASVMLHFHRTEGQTRRELFSTFRRHLPVQKVRALMDAQGEGLTQNERRIVTVMFTDIQGFSRMGEKLPPDQIIQILNEYFAAMTEIIFANQGVLDKYIGDGIMAVYGNIGSNNPRQDAHYAVKTALEMQDKMAELQKKWMNEGIRPIQIRIGINTGEALVGYVGHPDRKEMTVIGDTVNTAARIEKLNKQYHTHILISHSTYEYIKDRAEVRPLGEEQLAGKSSSVMVYELKGWKAQSLV